MATNSAATRRAARDGNGYRTGIAKVPGARRCDTCRHCTKACSNFGVSKYDRLCTLFAAGVKTHGGCARYESEGAKDE